MTETLVDDIAGNAIGARTANAGSGDTGRQHADTQGTPTNRPIGCASVSSAEVNTDAGEKHQVNKNDDCGYTHAGLPLLLSNH
jgi:hypothetical protein